MNDSTNSNDNKLKEMQNAIESFAPELLQALEQGVYRRVVIPGDTSLRPPDPTTGEVDTRSLDERQRDAIKGLRYTAARLRTLRKVMKQAGDPRAPLLWRAIVRNVDTRRLELVIEPRDGQIASLLRPVLDQKPDTQSDSALDDLAEALKE